jgi:hypothetical protein
MELKKTPPFLHNIKLHFTGTYMFYCIKFSAKKNIILYNINIFIYSVSRHLRMKIGFFVVAMACIYMNHLYIEYMSDK